MLGDVVFNLPILDICGICRIPQSLFSGTDEGGRVVISKHEALDLKIGTAPISGPVVLIYLEIEFIVCTNASLYDFPYKTTSRPVARVKGSCPLQILVRGGSVIFFAVKDRRTLNHLVIMRDIF